MGWFAIAFIAGFLAFWQWREWPNWSDGKRQAWLLAIGLIILVLIGIAIGYACKYSVAFLLDRIGQGYVGRILLGSVLGIATAYVVEHRSQVHAAQLKILETGAHQRRAATISGKESDHAAPEGIGGMSLTGALWVAVVVVLFAISAPHLDNWLRRATSVKTPFGELQVASLGVRPSLKADSIDLLADTQSMAALSNYDGRIRQDEEYLRQFEIPELDALLSQDPASAAAIQPQIDDMRKIADAARELYPVFNGLIRPIANCVRDAIANGLAIDSMRMKARPMADALQHILYVEDKAGFDKEYRESHEKFWEELKKLPVAAAPFLAGDSGEKCRTIGTNYKGELPQLKKYRTTPYLYVAALLFANFMRDDEVVLKIINDKKGQMAFKDYRFLFFAGSLANYHGRAVETGFEMLDKMRQTARARRDKLRLKKEGCTEQKCDQTRINLISLHYKRERVAVLAATNSLAYLVAEDLAQGGKAGERYRARLDGFAEDLRLVIEQNDSEDKEERDGYIDTYAYVTIVLEAQKKDPSIGKIKEMVLKLEKVVESLEKEVSQSIAVDRTIVNILKLTRAHLAAARELAGQ